MLPKKAEEEPPTEEEPRVFALHRSAQLPCSHGIRRLQAVHPDTILGPSTRIEYTRNARPKWPNGIENGFRTQISSHPCPREILEKPEGEVTLLALAWSGLAICKQMKSILG